MSKLTSRVTVAAILAAVALQAASREARAGKSWPRKSATQPRKPAPQARTAPTPAPPRAARKPAPPARPARPPAPVPAPAVEATPPPVAPIIDTPVAPAPVAPAPVAPAPVPIVVQCLTAAPAPPASVAFVEPAPTSAPAPVTAADTATPSSVALAKQLAIGSGGRFQPGANFQTWFCVDDREGCAAVPGLGDATFRIRRAELTIKGEIVPGQVTYALMFDPSRVLETQPTTVAITSPDGTPATVTVKQPVSPIATLQDLYLTYTHRYAEVSAGQFKIPVSWEGYNSAAKLLFPERALVATRFGDKRDLGIRVAKAFKRWMYSAGVFNGQALGNLDSNNQKDLGLRVEVYPVAGLTVGAVTYDSVFQRERVGTKDRWEGDLRFERANFLFQSEVIAARDVVSKDKPAVHAHGFYAAVAYRLPGNLQPAVRVGAYDPDTSVDVDPAMAGGADEVRQLDLGLTYYLRSNELKLQAAFSRFQFDQKTAENQAIAAAQVSF